MLLVCLLVAMTVVVACVKGRTIWQDRFWKRRADKMKDPGNRG